MVFLNYFFVFICYLFGQNLVDGVVAVVGKQPLLHSDIVQQSQIIASSKNVDPIKNPYAFQKIYDQSLEMMINQYVILDVAEKDTNMLVTDEEIERALNQRIDEFILQAGSEKKFEELMGMPLRKIKGEYWNEIRNMMYVERYKFSKIQNIDISRIEVENFYKTFKDSLPPFPENYDYSIIEIPFIISKNSHKKTYDFLDPLRILIVEKKLSFDDLANIHSEDPGSKNSGGRLGFTKRGSLVFEYEEVAFSLNPGEISLPIKSNFGFHLIKLIDRKGEKISSQHILKTISISETDKKNTAFEINKIKLLCKNDPFMFDSIAVDYQTKHNNQSGTFNNIDINNIPYHILLELQKISDYEIGLPFKTNFGFSIIFLYEHKKEFSPNLNNSWTLIQQYALQKKQNKFFNTLIEELKEQTYILKLN